MTDLFCVSGTSPTEVRQNDCPTIAPQHKSFSPSDFHAVPTESLKCDTSTVVNVVERSYALCLRPLNDGHGDLCADCWDRIRAVILDPPSSSWWLSRSSRTCACVLIGAGPICIPCLRHSEPVILDVDRTALWYASLRVFLPDPRPGSGWHYEYLRPGEVVPPAQPNLIVVPAQLHFADRTDRLILPPNGVFHRIVEHYEAGNASVALHRRMAWTAYVNHTGKVTSLPFDSRMQLLDRIEIRLPPASLYDQQKPWAQFDLKLYAQEILRNQKREWVDPRIKYWISQGHTDRDPNYNHRERFQYRDWMFWNGSGLSHQPSQLATYHRSFWLNQGLTKEAGPEVRPGGVGFTLPRSFHGDEYSSEYQAQLLLRICESVRISWNTINQQTAPAHFDIIEERPEARWIHGTYELSPAPPVVSMLKAKPHLRDEMVEIEVFKNEVFKNRCKFGKKSAPDAPLTKELQDEWEARLRLEGEELVKEHGEHFKGFYNPEGYSDRPGLGLCKTDAHWHEKKKYAQGYGSKLAKGFESFGNDEQEDSEQIRHLNNGADYIDNHNQTDKGASTGWDEERQLPTPGWVPIDPSKLVEEFAMVVRAAVGLPNGATRTPENERLVKSYSKFKAYAFQLNVMKNGLRKQKEGVKSKAVVMQFKRGRERRAKILELAKLGNNKFDPEFVEAYINWLKESPLPGGFYVVLKLKENQPRLYRLDCPTEPYPWTPEDSYEPPEAIEAFAELRRTKRTDAERRAAVGDKRAARRRINDIFSHSHTYWLQPDTYEELQVRAPSVLKHVKH